MTDFQDSASRSEGTKQHSAVANSVGGVKGLSVTLSLSLCYLLPCVFPRFNV